MTINQSILATLEEKVRFYEERARRYRDAAELVRAELAESPTTAGPRGAYAAVVPPVLRRQASDPKQSTMAMIGEVLSHSNEPLSVAAPTESMLAEGWDTSSETPANTVRTAVGRLVERGAVEKTDDGRYGLPHRVVEDISDEPQ